MQPFQSPLEVAPRTVALSQAEKLFTAFIRTKTHVLHTAAHAVFSRLIIT